MRLALFWRSCRVVDFCSGSAENGDWPGVPKRETFDIALMIFAKLEVLRDTEVYQLAEGRQLEDVDVARAAL